MKLYLAWISTLLLPIYLLIVLWLLRQTWRGTWRFFGPFSLIVFVYLAMLDRLGRLIINMPGYPQGRWLLLFMALALPFLCFLAYRWKKSALESRDVRVIFAVLGAAYVSGNMIGLFFFMALVPLPLCFLAYRWKKSALKSRRVWAVLAVAGAAYVIALGDVTLHSWNMAKACPKAGVRIYRTVKVDGFIPSSEYSILSRIPKGYLVGDTPAHPVLGLATRWKRTDSGISEWEIAFTGPVPDYELGVIAYREVAQNRLTKEIVAEFWRFRAQQGWIDAKFGPDINPGGCQGGSWGLHNSIKQIFTLPKEQS
jgi:hypothetical protein